ncbi:MAG: hypothetical protein ABI333_04725 [bacterium]
MSAPQARTGWIDAAARIARTLLRSPRFKARVKIIVNHIDPDSTPELVRTLLWTDPEVALSLLGAAPHVANAAIGALGELTRQLQTLPPTLAREVLADLASAVNTRGFGEAVGRLVALGLSWRVERPTADCAAHSSFCEGFVAALRETGKLPEDRGVAWLVVDHLDRCASRLEREVKTDPEAVAILAEGLRKVLADHPDLVREVLQPLLRPLQDALEKGEAAP